MGQVRSGRLGALQPGGGSCAVKDLAAKEPERLEKLKELWAYYAGLYNGFPLDDRTAIEQAQAKRPQAAPDRERYTYFPDCADVPREGGVKITGRSYTIAVGVEIDTAKAEGVIYADGGVSGGHSLYVKDKLRYTFNWVGTTLQNVVADTDLTTGQHVFTADFTMKGKNDDPAMPGFKGTLNLYMDDQQVGSGEIVTQPGFFCIAGDGICVGATAPRRSRPITSRRSGSRAGRSTRSSSTSRASRSSMKRRRSGPGSAATRSARQ